MGVTLSHLSALDALRTIRSNGVNIRDAEPIRLTDPSVWVGTRWLPSTFEDYKWKWGTPTSSNPLHVLVPNRARRIRMAHVNSYGQLRATPAGSVLWLDECSSLVCPELLFLQMASSFSLPALTLLGYELCGHFSRDAQDPLEGVAQMELPTATSVESISSYLAAFTHVPGITRARTALSYITDHAASPPEALLATMYSLPPKESGYGMGPVVLNTRVDTTDPADASAKRSRYPDVLFSFAPVGINYDGEGHLDLEQLVSAAQNEVRADAKDRESFHASLNEVKRNVHNKVVDDIRRNRQLITRGKIILPATKEDLYGWGSLDNLTRQILTCARSFFGTDTSTYENALENTEKARDRYALLTSYLPGGRRWGSSHGNL